MEDQQRVTKQHDVFLSFRGEDTRKTIVSHLHKALIDRGINTFKDDKKLEIGDNISDEIREAIQNSKISVVVISENFASSTWCLNELQMIVELHKRHQLTAVPIFYNVATSDVRHQRGTFTLERYEYSRIKRFFSSKKRRVVEKIKKWREALTEIAGISGKDSRACDNEAAMIEDIVGSVSRKLFSMETVKFSDIVGMEAHMKQLSPLLNMEESEVRILGLWGMGGVGKTTIAKYLYEELLPRFSPHCCFIENVKSCAENGLVHLQKKLLASILGEYEELRSVEHGCSLIMSRIGNRKVLLVLDDIDNMDQLHALAKENSWFGPGSRIIITTRDKGLLFSSGVRIVYHVDVLEYDDAIQVFKQSAFEGGETPDVYEQLSIRASSLAQGLPSALKAFGTHLRRMTSIEEWEEALERLKNVPHQSILEILRSSYMGLDRRHRAVFLHVACLFNGDSVRCVIALLDAGQLEIKGLAEKSLIHITADGCITMNTLVEQVGKEIMREQSDSTPSRQRVLWEHKQIISVLQNYTGTETIESLALHMCEMPQMLYIKGQVFNTINLKFLKVFRHLNNTESRLQFLPHTDNLPQQLRLLHWDAYPLKTLPSTFNPYNLVEINLRYSSLEHLWSGHIILPLLRRLDVTCSHNLVQLPDLSGAGNLEELLMEGCLRLKQNPMSILSVSSLQKLNLFHCGVFSHLPIYVSKKTGHMQHRQIILLLPGAVNELRSLANILIEGEIQIQLQNLAGDAEHLSCISEQQIPDELMAMPKERVQLRSTSSYDFKLLNIKRFKYTKYSSPFSCISFSGFPFLAELKLINLNIQKIPDNIGQLQLLEKLDLSGNEFKNLPPTTKNLFKLRHVRLCNCSKLETLPELTQLQTLKLSGCSNLRSLWNWARNSLLELGIDDCKNVQLLSYQLSHCSNLTYLDLSRHDFEAIPESIRELVSLGTLYLNNCKKLKSVGELPQSLKHLYAHGCDSLENVTISPHHSIKHLDLSHCFSLKQDGQLISQFLNDGNSQKVSQRFLCLPGNEVPRYFDDIDHRTSGKSTKITIPPIRYNRTLLGFAACIIISCERFSNLQFPAFSYDLNYEDDGVIRVNVKPTLYLSPEMVEEETVEMNHLIIINVPNCINTRKIYELRLESHLQFPEGNRFPLGEIKGYGIRMITRRNDEYEDEEGDDD